MEEELLKTLGDFTSRENWDKFFTIKGSHDPFEWYSEWLEVSDMLLHELRSLAPASPDARGTEYRSGSAAAPDATACRILVPGCGNSRLSECLHDAGFRDIINIDFSRVVISDMLRLHIRTRPSMRWRVMDMTDLQVLFLVAPLAFFVCLKVFWSGLRLYLLILCKSGLQFLLVSFKIDLSTNFFMESFVFTVTFHFLHRFLFVFSLTKFFWQI